MSCLFNSLSAFVAADDQSQSIRQRICDFLATDPLMCDGLPASVAVQKESGKDLSEYVQSMRSPNTWGGAIEIRSFVLLWKRPVKVWDIRQRRWIEFPTMEGSMDNAIQISWTGGHYEPMRGAAVSVTIPAQIRVTPELAAPPKQEGGNRIVFRRTAKGFTVHRE